ncbi:MAG: cysteine desulfurase [Oscillospiraceae bacterium]|nr:cysteine desulfurase [Oscillospiraceae bacterium]
MIYFDNASTTKPCEAAVDTFVRTARHTFGNASSLHSLGIEAEKLLTRAKKIISNRWAEKYSDDFDLTFTSGGTESNNLAILGSVAKQKRGKNRIVTTAIEHESVLAPLKFLEDRYEIIKVGEPSQACFENISDAIISAVDEQTALLSFMAVNNETGLIIDSTRIYKEVKLRFPDCIVHVDAAQGFLKLPVVGDLVSFSGHKLHSPKGIGALLVKKGVKLAPIMFGGARQGDVRAGTPPTELITSLSAAVENYEYNADYINALNQHFTSQLQRFKNIRLNSYTDKTIPDIINFSVLGVRSEVLVHFLAECQVYVSSGSACGRGKPSHVLRALGLSDKIVDSAIRVSFCMDNTTAEIDEFFICLKKILERLRV